MTREEFVLNAIKEQGYSLKSFADKIDMRYTTLLSILKEGSLGGAAVDRVSKICRGIGITIDDLVSVDNTTAPITADENTLLSLYRNADSRAQADASILLRSHQIHDDREEPELIREARQAISRADAQNGHSSLPSAK